MASTAMMQYNPNQENCIDVKKENPLTAAQCARFVDAVLSDPKSDLDKDHEQLLVCVAEYLNEQSEAGL